MDSVDEAVDAVGRLGTIAPEACRANAEERFTAEVMARGYVGAYERAMR